MIYSLPGEGSLTSGGMPNQSLRESANRVRAIKIHAIGIADAGAAEDVQSGTDREVDPITAGAGDFLEVRERFSAARVSGGNRAPFGKALHQFMIDAKTEAFHIDSVDQ